MPYKPLSEMSESLAFIKDLVLLCWYHSIGYSDLFAQIPLSFLLSPVFMCNRGLS